MAVHLMTTTGSLTDVNAALGIAAGSAPAPEGETGPIVAQVEALPPRTAPAETAAPVAEPPAEPETPPAEATPQDATVPVAEEVPDSEFDEDGEPLTERAARSSRTKLQTIKRLRARARTAETELARTQGELAALRAIQTRGQEPTIPDASPSVVSGMDGEEPKEADYATYEAWIEARADYRARKAVREELESRHREDERLRLMEASKARIKAFAAEHPDYDEVISNPTLKITEPMAYALQRSEDGPAMAYALAKDPPRAARIAAMAPEDALVAIGELRAEVRLASAPAKAAAPPLPKSPAAPPPPTPVRGSSVAAAVSLEDFAKGIQPGDPKTSEWIRRRNEQLARQQR